MPVKTGSQTIWASRRADIQENIGFAVAWPRTTMTNHLTLSASKRATFWNIMRVSTMVVELGTSDLNL